MTIRIVTDSTCNLPQATIDRGGATEIISIHVSASLSYLKRSGRMNGVVAGLGSLLQLKPIRHMHRGKVDAKPVRTRSRAMARLVEILEQVGPVEQAVLLHTAAAERAEQFRAQVQQRLPAGPLSSVEITPVIGAHVGPGVVGLAVVTAQS